MKVSRIMTRNPVIAAPDQTLREAAEAMQRNDAGFLPVGQKDRLVGSVTDRDIAVRGIGSGKGPDNTVREVMTDDVLYCYEDDDTADVAANMGREQVRRLPVVNRDKQLVGIVSLGDIALRGDDARAGEALEGIVRPA